MPPTLFPTALDSFADYDTRDWPNGNPHPPALINQMLGAIDALEARAGISSHAATTGAQSYEYLFTETAVAAGTMTASVTIPAGATLLEVSLHATAVWDSSGAVTAKVGDGTDDDGIFTAVNMKATDLTAGQAIAASGGTGTSGGKEGADIIATHWNRRYLSTARVVSCIITLASTGGTAGRTRFRVTWAPEPSTVGTPTYVAS